MNQTELPSPIYAAAGAGELAYQKLRHLPETAARTMRSAGLTAEELRHRADELRQRFGTRQLELPTEWARVRDSAQRGTATVVARAAEAQERAAAGYRRLVARGERVVADRIGVTTGHAEPVGVEVGPVRSADRPSQAGKAAEAGMAGKAGKAAQAGTAGKTAQAGTAGSGRAAKAGMAGNGTGSAPAGQRPAGAPGTE